MTVKGGSRPACAACRFQRRRCSPDCPLAPYFPANQSKMFRYVHRLYGVGNIMKILNQLKDNEQKQEAMKSIKYESYIRAICPVEGCHGTIISLQHQLITNMRELHCVQAQLAACREVNMVHGAPQAQELKLGIGHQLLGGESPGFCYGESSDDTSAGNMVARQMQLLALQPSNSNCDDQMMIRNNVNLMEIQAQFGDFQSCGVQGMVSGGQISPDYDEMVFNTLADDQQSFAESSEACESSSVSSMKDTKQLMEQESKDNYLRSAAACFSLTSASID